MAKTFRNFQKLSPVASFVHSLRSCLVLIERGGEERRQKNYEDVFDHIA